MRRRRFLGAAAAGAAWRGARAGPAEEGSVARGTAGAAVRTLFLAGDVMTGRGIDQILPHPGDPRLHEPWMRSARGYVAIAEDRAGPLPRAVAFDYIWGDALPELDRVRPQARIVNLETAVTTAGDAWPGKGIHYRMEPRNVPCLTAARLDCCVLANNHVLDWGHDGLRETLATLRSAGIRTAGAGASLAQAAAPASIELAAGGRVLVFAFAATSSGVPPDWAAGDTRPGLHVLPDLSAATLAAIAARVRGAKRAGDTAIASVHWGGNWGYHVGTAEREFAQGLIDSAGIDVVHGHSSHHPLGLEIWHERLIIYGCGDLLNDYEGIGGHEDYRPELALMYFPGLDPASGRLVRLGLAPLRIARFRLERATAEAAAWLATRLDREGGRFGTGVSVGPDGLLHVHW